MVNITSSLPATLECFEVSVFIIIFYNISYGDVLADSDNTPIGLNPEKDLDNAPRLFITGNREVYLFYYGNGWLRARKYYVKPIPGNVGSVCPPGCKQYV